MAVSRFKGLICFWCYYMTASSLNIIYSMPNVGNVMGGGNMLYNCSKCNTCNLETQYYNFRLIWDQITPATGTSYNMTNNMTNKAGHNPNGLCSELQLNKL